MIYQRLKYDKNFNLLLYMEWFDQTLLYFEVYEYYWGDLVKQITDSNGYSREFDINGILINENNVPDHVQQKRDSAELVRLLEVFNNNRFFGR